MPTINYGVSSEPLRSARRWTGNVSKKQTSLLARLVLVAAAFVVIRPLPTPAQNSGAYLPPDVTLGDPFVRPYQRIYPLLDGIFQDVASTQLPQLTLNPNAPNGSNVNAILNAFQAGVSFSATTGAQNSVAQQINNVLANNTGLQNQAIGLQSQLLTQQTQLVQSAVTAQQQVGVAQTLVDQLKASNGDSDKQTQAAQALSSATDNLNAINAQIKMLGDQLTQIKGQTPQPGNLQSLTPPSAATPANPPGLPSAWTSLANPPSGNSAPTFPSTKQMDNQINLLWERLARLVSTLTQPDSLKDYQMDLAQIDIGVVPVSRKHQLLGVQYELRCAEGSGVPVIVDLFPSASAVNIVDTKYKDNQFGISGVFGWLFTGVNAAYNRDHLQISQALGQTGYITGFGVGTPAFGWFFGRNLGDDTVTPGNRRVFALIGVPSTCGRFTIQARRAKWFKEKQQQWYEPHPNLIPDGIYDHTYDSRSGQEYPPVLLAQNAAYVPPQAPPAPSRVPNKPVSVPSSPTCTLMQFSTDRNSIKTIGYTLAEYDPAARAKTLVSVALTTVKPIDSQQIVSVNGRILKRSRDSFGRAINATTAGGLLETSALDPNSWLPTSSNDFTLTLDPTEFGQHFPDIQVQAPSGSFSTDAALSARTTDVLLAGRRLCYSSRADLPALGYPASASKVVKVDHWHPDSPKLDRDILVLSVPGDPSGQDSVSGALGLKVITTNDPAAWGADPLVLASSDDTTYRLACHGAGLTLVCAVPSGQESFFDAGFTLELRDPEHTTQAIHSRLNVDSCLDGRCVKPQVWRIGDIQWRSDPVKNFVLEVPIQVINFGKGVDVELRGTMSAKVATTHCEPRGDGTCSAVFEVPQAKFPDVTDSMELRFVRGSVDSTAGLKYLRSRTQPVVTAVNDSQNVFTGQNLFVQKLRVGDAVTDVLDLRCSGQDGTECRVASYPEKFEGYLYFLDAAGNASPVVIIAKEGVSTPVFHAAPKPTKPTPEKPKPATHGKEKPATSDALPPPPEQQRASPSSVQKFSSGDVRKRVEVVQ